MSRKNYDASMRNELPKFFKQIINIIFMNKSKGRATINVDILVRGFAKRVFGFNPILITLTIRESIK